ncbi:hypothetical protein SA19103_12530 [Staphylococcus argenteus]|uniref:hypothetical protein n=1 Tax=Staphylococcus argenteus TaxID=985002 RepID=UPI001FB9DFA6|nr:hypothetical protein [Staphylococcus argenteus]GJF57113.1 hypothetical protein SA19103_12530 [Staphylococcus argenteus]
MRKLMQIMLCASIILSGCSFMHKDQTKSIPKTVSVKDYDGKYIGEHKKRNEVFLKKHKDEAIKKYKDYVKDTFARLKFKSEVEKNGYFAMNEKLQVKQEYNGVVRQYLNFKTPGIEGIDKFKKEFKPLMNKSNSDFNQKFDALLMKHPEIKDQAKTNFIAYYSKNKTRDIVGDYVVTLQKPTNKVMKNYLGIKFMKFYKDSVSPSQLDKNGRLKPEVEEVSTIGGE